MSRPPLTILQAELSVPAIAAALGLTPDEVVRKFRDPRITSWFAEIWGERLFSYKTHLSSNHPGSDARVEMGALGRFEISVRSFNTNSIKFQKSRHIGSGRKATQEDLIAAIEEVERIVVVDLRGFPVLRFVPLDSKLLLRLIRQGRLTASGITPKRFDTWLAETFDLEIRQTVIAQPLPTAAAFRPASPPPPGRPADLFG